MFAFCVPSRKRAAKKTIRNFFSTVFHIDTNTHTHTRAHTYSIGTKKTIRFISAAMDCSLISLCGSFFRQLLHFVFVYQFISLASVYVFFCSSIQLDGEWGEKLFSLCFFFTLLGRSMVDLDGCELTNARNGINSMVD